MKRILLTYAALFAVVLIFALCATAHCQVAVAQAPPIHFQFFSANGQPLANGKIYTYQAGTSTLQNTYVDALGLIQNLDPIPLDSSGSPSNGSTSTSIFLANLSYKFVAYNSSGVFQWSVDNIAGYYGGLLNSANTWTATQTFANQIIDTLTDNQTVFGAPGNQTTLDFPPPASNVTLHMPNTADTIVARNTTDTLANKSLTTPNINGINIPNSPGTYESIPNGTAIGTSLNTLSKMLCCNGALAVVRLTQTTDTSGVVGICVANCTTSGNGLIQESGTVSCVFDNATTGGDYVQISSTTQGNCHDAGSTFPSTGQVVGRVLTTNGGAGTYAINLFGPELSNLSTIHKQTNITSGLNLSGTGVQVTTLLSPAADTNMVVTVSIYNTTAGVGCSVSGTYIPYVAWTDPSGTSFNTGNFLSLQGTSGTNATQSFSVPVFVKGGTSLSTGINVTVAASGCSPAPVVATQATAVY